VAPIARFAVVLVVVPAFAVVAVTPPGAAVVEVTTFGSAAASDVVVSPVDVLVDSSAVVAVVFLLPPPPHAATRSASVTTPMVARIQYLCERVGLNGEPPSSLVFIQNSH
jgi:hypothetical protein